MGRNGIQPVSPGTLTGVSRGMEMLLPIMNDAFQSATINTSLQAIQHQGMSILEKERHLLLTSSSPAEPYS